MKSDKTLNTKEVRKDLLGFLKRLKHGEKLTILYRSKPLVTLMADQPDQAQIQADDAGTPQAVQRSLQFASQLSQNRPTKFDPDKSVKELYRESMDADYDAG